MESENLARELCDRMQDVVPPKIRVSTEGDKLVFRSGYSTGRAGSYACQWLCQGTGSLSERLQKAARLAFHDLQDFVDEETTEPWPGMTTPPAPDTRIQAGRLLIWFGDPTAPDLEITPLLVESE